MRVVGEFPHRRRLIVDMGEPDRRVVGTGGLLMPVVVDLHAVVLLLWRHRRRFLPRYHQPPSIGRQGHQVQHRAAVRRTRRRPSLGGRRAGRTEGPCPSWRLRLRALSDLPGLLGLAPRRLRSRYPGPRLTRVGRTSTSRDASHQWPDCADRLTGSAHSVCRRSSRSLDPRLCQYALYDCSRRKSTYEHHLLRASGDRLRHAVE